MSTQTPTQTPTPTPTPGLAPKALEELHTALDQIRDNKDKPTAAEGEHWSRLVAAVFTDPDCPVDTLFQELSSFPPNVVAGGIASAWENMDEARRTSYLSWLKTLGSVKAAPQKVVLIPSLLERFPSVSLELLCDGSLGQGLKKGLASAILDTAPEKVALMISSDTTALKARTALDRLCRISEEPNVGMRAKWEVLSLTLKTIVERKMQKDVLFQSLIQHVKDQLPKLLPPFPERLQDLLKDLDTDLLGRLFPSATGAETAGLHQETSHGQDEAVAQMVSAGTPLVSPGIDTGTSEEHSVPSNVLDRLGGWLDTLHGQATLLTDTRARILQLEQGNQTLRAQLDAARVAEEAARASAAEASAAQQQTQHRLQVLEEQYTETQKTLNSSLTNIRELESELNAARERESQWGTKLRERETEFVKDRESLQCFIESNAKRRLQEFSNAVGGSLRKLLNKVPDRGAPVPSELGEVLLVRLHEVMDELEAKGIRARPEREASL